MKIEKLNIYGFGKHENVTIDFGPGIKVLYGLNEAGKTTIQQFILHILFGFPQRNNVLFAMNRNQAANMAGKCILWMRHMGNVSSNGFVGNLQAMLLFILRMDQGAEKRN